MYIYPKISTQSFQEMQFIHFAAKKFFYFSERERLFIKKKKIYYNKYFVYMSVCMCVCVFGRFIFENRLF